jgi:hypothetical protein
MDDFVSAMQKGVHNSRLRIEAHIDERGGIDLASKVAE